jgi:phage major head subunit gpT-like protein
MKPLNLTASINLKANATGKPRRFSILAYSGGLLPVEGFPYPVICDLAGLETPTQIPILIDHTKSVEATLGLTDAILNDGQTLSLTGPVTGVSVTAKQVIAQADGGHTWQASIGASVIESEDIAPGQSVSVNGQTFVGPVIVARRSVLRETSVLPMGADSTTSVNLAARAAANLKGASMPTFEEWLASLNIDPAGLSPEDMAAMQLAYDAKQAPPVAAAPAVAPVAAPVVAPTASAGAKALDIVARAQQDIEAANKMHAANSRRIAEIKAMAAGYPDIEATAIEKGWSTDKVDAEVSRKRLNARVGVTSFGNGDRKVSQENQGLVLEAALCVKGGSTTAEKNFRPEILQAAHSQFHGAIGLKDTIMIVAHANGYQGMSFNIDPSAAFRAAWGNEKAVNLRAGFSTISLPGILANTAKKFLLEGYETVEETWRQIAAVNSVSDFKEVTSYRMAVDGKFEKIGPNGTIKPGTVSEESYTNQAETYAKMLSITRRDIINDDLGALTRIPRQLGRGAATAFNTIFWTEFLADSATFFPTDLSKKNYQEGSGTALSIASLTAAELLFLNQTDPYGEPMAIEPQILLVPNALNVTASQLSRDTEVRDTTASTKYTTGNPHAGKFTPVRSSYLSNSTITGYSTTAWYLLANPNDVAMIEAVFLNGNQSPTIEEAEADFSTLGVQMRGYFDFGVNKQDYRAAVKSKGAA